MKGIIRTTVFKRVAGIAMIMGMLFAVSATSTFAQERYYRNRQSGGQKAATIGGGAAVGAIIGSLAGGGKGALIGGLIGAGVGTGIVAHKNHQNDGYRYGYYDNRYYNSGYNNRYYNSAYNNGYYNSGYNNRYVYRDRYNDNYRRGWRH